MIFGLLFDFTMAAADNDRYSAPLTPSHGTNAGTPRQRHRLRRSCPSRPIWPTARVLFTGWIISTKKLRDSIGHLALKTAL